ncbi:MAG: hypothetical protein ACRD0P_14015 [Stackebrandtia sp.]
MFFTNVGPTWVVIVLLVGRRVVTNVGPTLVVIFASLSLGVEVEGGVVEGGAVRADQT